MRTSLGLRCAGEIRNRRRIRYNNSFVRFAEVFVRRTDTHGPDFRVIAMSELSVESKDRIGKAIGRIPSGCSIVTVRSASGLTGMLASWVQQAAFEPPMISMAMKRDRPAEKLIDEAGGFVVNILGENPTAMFRHFGKGFSPEQDAFAGLEVKPFGSGLVISDQIAWLSTRVTGKHAAGDHWIYLAEVVDAGVGELAPPHVHIRKNGLSY
jgi:flavin reductase (DIM6/NTAB) family NADH-FMN oxidoreductase RutF